MIFRRALSRLVLPVALSMMFAGAVASPAVAQGGPTTSETTSSAGWTITGSGPSADYLSYCYGNFGPLRVVNNRLEWGADQTCENLRDRPHWIVVKLQESCPDFCVVFNTDDEQRSSFSEDYTRVVRVSERSLCVDNDRRRVRMVVNAFARGGQGTAVAISDEIVVRCDVD